MYFLFKKNTTWKIIAQIIEELYKNILLHNNIEIMCINLQRHRDNYNFSKSAVRLYYYYTL